MKKFVLILLILTIFVSPFTSFAGVWDTSCADCHNGRFAYSKKQLLAKYKTKIAFIRAAKTTRNPAMKYINGIAAAADELYPR